MVAMGRLQTVMYGKMDVMMQMLRAMAFDTYRMQILLNKTMERRKSQNGTECHDHVEGSSMFQAHETTIPVLRRAHNLNSHHRHLLGRMPDMVSPRDCYNHRRKSS